MDRLAAQFLAHAIEVRSVSAESRQVTAVALDTGELACSHERMFAKNRTVTALEHARALRDRHGEEDRESADEPFVEQRSLSIYDRLIA